MKHYRTAATGLALALGAVLAPVHAQSAAKDKCVAQAKTRYGK